MHELPDDPTLFSKREPHDSQGRVMRAEDPITKEGARLVEICAKLGRRLAYSINARKIGPETPKCEHCNASLLPVLPDQETRETFAHYSKATLKLMAEQRARVEIIYKYDLQPKMGGDEVRKKIAEIVEAEVLCMSDPELDELLEKRKMVIEGSAVEL